MPKRSQALIFKLGFFCFLFYFPLFQQNLFLYNGIYLKVLKSFLTRTYICCKNNSSLWF